MASGDELAGIQYHGIAGASLDCQNAVMRLLQFGDRIPKAHILSCANAHCLLLSNEIGDRIAVKSGFASGYGGEGPRRFSYVLQFLYALDTEIEEVDVDEDMIERLDRSALTTSDLDVIDTAKPVRPKRWPSYLSAEDFDRAHDGTLWREFPPVIPLAIIDPRIADLALSFWDEPDNKLLKGYRRLEDIFRRRADIDEHGAKLFSKAFTGDEARLFWKDLNEGQKAGRLNLFTGAFLAHRNSRAHRELKASSTELLSEFLVLNHLYRLEREVASAAPANKP